MHPENKSKILATTATVLTFGLTSCAEGFVSPTQNSPDDNANHPRPANTLEAQNSGQEQQSQQEISKQQVQLDRYLVDRALGEWKEIRYSQETWRAENPKFEIDNSISHPRNPDGSVNENKLVTIAFNDIAQPDNGDKKTGRFAWLIEQDESGSVSASILLPNRKLTDRDEGKFVSNIAALTEGGAIQETGDTLEVTRTTEGFAQAVIVENGADDNSENDLRTELVENGGSESQGDQQPAATPTTPPSWIDKVADLSASSVAQAAEAPVVTEQPEPTIEETQESVCAIDSELVVNKDDREWLEDNTRKTQNERAAMVSGVRRLNGNTPLSEFHEPITAHDRSSLNLEMFPVLISDPRIVELNVCQRELDPNNKENIIEKDVVLGTPIVPGLIQDSKGKYIVVHFAMLPEQWITGLFLYKNYGISESSPQVTLKIEDLLPILSPRKPDGKYKYKQYDAFIDYYDTERSALDMLRRYDGQTVQVIPGVAVNTQLNDNDIDFASKLRNGEELPDGVILGLSGFGMGFTSQDEFEAIKALELSQEEVSAILRPNK